MHKPQKILVTGGCGQIGTELVAALRARYSADSVVATDVVSANGVLPLNVLDEGALAALIVREQVTQIYHLAASLSAKAEQQPLLAWDLNMKGLLHVLEAARKHGLETVFWPSSIAVFGPASLSSACTQHSLLDPITVYGLSKMAGEYWCRYYFEQYGLDVRSIRYPGLISHTAQAGGGTTDYAVEIFSAALEQGHYTCYLKPNTGLPMMYMDDAIRGTLELMEAPAAQLTVRTSYNLAAFNFTPQELSNEIARHVPGFRIEYAPDFRQRIADSWPKGILDSHARHDWGWLPRYDMPAMVSEMLAHLKLKYYEKA